MNNDSELLRGNVPALVLAALENRGPQHGYAIAQDINKRTNNSLQFKQGTLYPVLHTLEENGFVVGEWRHEGGTRPRLVYAITDTGRTELSRRIDAWKAFSGAMDILLGSGKAGGSHEPTS